MRIDCPWCGPRSLEEFHYGGDASLLRPENPESANEFEWIDYVYFRDNPAGLHAEHWQHVGGCRSWLVVERDTRTHYIQSVKLASSLKSESSEKTDK